MFSIMCFSFNSIEIQAKKVDAGVKWKYTHGSSGFELQENGNWCWAASARNMAVSKVTAVNVKKSQRDIVKAIKGKVQYVTATIQETSKATKVCNNSCQSKYKNSRLTFKQIKAKINKGGGIILDMQNQFYGGHAILLYGYSSDGDVKVYDPKRGVAIYNYTQLKKGNGLKGYTYEQSIYF